MAGCQRTEAKQGSIAAAPPMNGSVLAQAECHQNVVVTLWWLARIVSLARISPSLTTCC
jgi:hypothetical protein